MMSRRVMPAVVRVPASYQVLFSVDTIRGVGKVVSPVPPSIGDRLVQSGRIVTAAAALQAAVACVAFSPMATRVEVFPLRSARCHRSRARRQATAALRRADLG